VVASGGEDGTVCIWKVESGWFDGWGAEGWEAKDFDPVVRIDASLRKIGQVAWHPTAQHVLASASAEHTIKLWDLNATEKAQITLAGHNDAIQSVAWDPTGQLIATTCRDRKLRLFDPRASTEAIRAVDGHGGIKGARVIWMGDRGRLATTGFSKMSERQLGLWDAGSLDNIKTIGLDQSSGVLMPFWSDNGILFIGSSRLLSYEPA
jgi:coronin-1B/1C/6